MGSKGQYSPCVLGSIHYVSWQVLIRSSRFQCLRFWMINMEEIVRLARNLWMKRTRWNFVGSILLLRHIILMLPICNVAKLQNVAKSKRYDLKNKKKKKDARNNTRSICATRRSANPGRFEIIQTASHVKTESAKRNIFSWNMHRLQSRFCQRNVTFTSVT